MTARFFDPATKEWYLSPLPFSYSDSRLVVHERSAVLDEGGEGMTLYPTLEEIIGDEGIDKADEIYVFKGTFWSVFRDVFELACQRIHLNNRKKGFWPNNDSPQGSLRLALYPDTHGRNVGELLALMSSEHSEALDAYREGGIDKTDDKLTHRSGLFTEIADAVIRAMDAFGGLMADGGAILVEKVGYNDKSRGHLHGKRF